MYRAIATDKIKAKVAAIGMKRQQQNQEEGRIGGILCLYSSVRVARRLLRHSWQR